MENLLYDRSWLVGVTSELLDMRRDNLFCDVLLCGDDDIMVHAHSCIIAASSKFLRSRLEAMTDLKDGIVLKFECASKKEIEQIVDYMYTGRIGINKENLAVITSLASLLGLTKLNLNCTELEETSGIIGEKFNSSEFVDSTETNVMATENMAKIESFDDSVDENRSGNMVKIESFVNSMGENSKVEFEYNEPLKQQFKDQPEKQVELGQKTSLKHFTDNARNEKADLQPMNNVAIVEAFNQDADDIATVEENKPEVLESARLDQDTHETITVRMSYDDGKPENQHQDTDKGNAEVDTSIEQYVIVQTADDLLNVTQSYVAPTENSLENTGQVFLPSSTLASATEDEVYETVATTITATDKQFAEHSVYFDNTNDGPHTSLVPKRKKVQISEPYWEGDVIIYPCHLCPKKFQAKKALRSHLSRTHCNVRRYRCDQCHYFFKTANALKQHAIRHGQRNIKCQICNLMFYTKGELTVHERTHSGTKPYQCDRCQKSFITGHRLTRHKVVAHSMENPLHPTYSCNKCSKEFFTLHELESHKLSKHANKDCQYCSLSFVNWSDLLKHSRVEHPDCPMFDEDLGSTSIYECPICGFVCLTAGRLAAHKRRKHLLEKRFKCKEPGCKFTTDWQSALDKHIKIHKRRQANLEKCQITTANGEMLQCNSCSINFLSTEDFNRHTKLFHNYAKLYKCKYEGCSYESEFKYNLNRHYISHKSGRNQEKSGTHEDFMCSQCGKLLRNRKQLEGHERGHNENNMDGKQKDIVQIVEDSSRLGKELCLYCDKTFQNSSELEKHIRSVHKKSERPKFLMCPHCNELFKVPSQLRRHVSLKHIKEKRYKCTLCEYCNFDFLPTLKHFTNHHQDCPIPEKQNFFINMNA